MSRLGMGLLVFFVVLIILVLVVGGRVVGVWNTLNQNYQGVQGAKSHYSAALNTVPQKIEGVWTISQQYMDHESKTFKDYAAMRSAVIPAIQEFQSAVASGKPSESDQIKAAQGIQRQLGEMNNAWLNIRATAENNPQLRAAETSQHAMQTMEEGVNECKTALDDWISSIRTYNTYRGNAWPSVAGSFMAKFPATIQYYEGEVQKLDVKSLNPAKRQ
jgi:hypothetical protein